MIHQPVSVVSQCSLNAWLKKLASGDQRRLTGSGIAVCLFGLALNTTWLQLPAVTCLTLGDDVIRPSVHVRLLGVTFAEDLSLDQPGAMTSFA